MKRQNTIIPYFLLLSLFALHECKEIKGCDEKCKNKTNECLLKSLSVSNSIASTNSSSTSSGFTTTRSEVEPNDTFQDSYASSENALRGGVVGKVDILNASISTSSDIDIFDTSIGNKSYGSNYITQTNNLDKVTCNVYLKNNSLTRGSARLQTPTSTPDSSFIFQGRLFPSFSFSYVEGGAIVYLICNGTANTDYTLQLQSIAASSSPSIISLTTDYSLVSSCKDATKACEIKCNRGF